MTDLQVKRLATKTPKSKNPDSKKKGSDSSREEISKTGISRNGISRSKKRILELIEAGTAENTRAALKHDLNGYLVWAHRNGFGWPVQPDVLSAYIAHLVDLGRARATIRRAVSSISTAHKLAGLDSPAESQLVKRVLLGAARMARGPRQVSAMSLEDLLKILSAMGQSWIDKRNAAILALGWALALRVSELIALTTADIRRTDRGYLVRVGRSKTDQEGAGAYLGLPSGALADVFARWLALVDEMYNGAPGPVFPRLTAHGKWFPKPGRRPAISRRCVWELCHRVSLENEVGPYSPHSLRHGLITTAARLGVPEAWIQRQSRHSSVATLRGYISPETAFDMNPLYPIFDRFSGSLQNLKLGD